MNKFDITTTVDLPVGVTISCEPSLHHAILYGQVRGEISKEGDKYILRVKKDVTGKNALGPTGRFPEGKICAKDKGELAVGLAVDMKHGVVVLNFGEDMGWIAMEPELATEFADTVLNLANEIVEHKKENNGT